MSNLIILYINARIETKQMNLESLIKETESIGEREARLRRKLKEITKTKISQSLTFHVFN